MILDADRAALYLESRNRVTYELDKECSLQNV